ncbi:MAG: Spx/MgsR family RNA polymerase-binding regulatory protein [Burkholderiaceae bacterium]
MTDVLVYGIPNCDTVKRARAALTACGREYEFHDFKKSGVPLQAAAQWLTQCGWQPLINRQGSTWRKLSEDAKEAVHDERSALALMQSQPSVIKRPVIRWPDGTVTVGWDEKVQARLG